MRSKGGVYSDRRERRERRREREREREREGERKREKERRRETARERERGGWEGGREDRRDGESQRESECKTVPSPSAQHVFHFNTHAEESTKRTLVKANNRCRNTSVTAPSIFALITSLTIRAGKTMAHQENGELLYKLLWSLANTLIQLLQLSNPPRKMTKWVGSCDLITHAPLLINLNANIL